MPEELENVRKIFSWFLGLDGSRALGVHQIAQRCMREGIRVAVGAKGHRVKFPDRVRSNQIRSILGNPMYKGEWQHNGQRKPYPQLLIPPSDDIGDPQPVVPPEVWHAAEARLEETVRYGRKAATSKRLLAGLVICGSCGLPCHTNIVNLPVAGRRLRWVCPRRDGVDRSCWGTSYGSVLVEPLDQWVVEYAAPMLALEIKDLMDEGKDGALQRECDQLSAKLTETLRMETGALKKAMAALDEVQFAELAASLREDRLKMAKRIEEIRILLREDGRHIPTDPKRLLEDDPERLRDALSRSVYWIALTDKGVVLYNALEHHLAGRYRSRPNVAKVRQGRAVAPPDLDTLEECQTWFSNPGEFIKGRRHALGEAANRLSDQQLFPFPVSDEPKKRKSKKS